MRDLALIAAGLVLAVPVGAGAADEGPAPYFEMDGHAVWLSAPGVERFGTATVQFNRDNTTRHPDSDSEIEAWGGGFDMRLGFGVPGGLLPGWQLEFGASYAELSEHSSGDDRLRDFDIMNINGEAEFLMPTPVDGAGQTFLAIAGAGQQVLSEFDADIQLYELRLQLARPLDVLPGVETKVRIGLLGGELDQDYQIQQTAIGSGPVIIFPFTFFLADSGGFNEVNEEAESWFFGPVLGFALDAQVTEKIHAFVELEVALLAHKAELNAHQIVQGTAFNGPPCTEEDCTLSFRETDDELHFNARPRIEMGVEYDFGFAKLGVTGAFTYWTYAPEVVNPRRPMSTNSFLFDGNQASSRLSSGDMMSGEIGMRVVVPF